MPGILSWALMAGAAAVMPARAQPASCYSDLQCSAGFFCEVAVNICQDCLRCEELKREPPAVATSCIKSVAECGPCLQGLVYSGVAACVAADAGADDGALPVKIWFIIGFVILGVFIAMVIVILFARRKKDLFRISTATWLRSSCGPEAPPASAPEPPPPYNPYSAVRPDSPFDETSLPYSPPPLTDQESMDPFIKRAPPPGAREAAGSQHARVYHPPSYVRIDPQSPMSPVVKDESEPWPAIHSEDTTPHDWTPDTSTNDDNGNPSGSEAAAVVTEVTPSESSSDLPALLAAARETTLVAPPAKKLKTQDNNNNGNRGGSSSAGEAAAFGLGRAHASDAPSIYLNIVQINNTKL